MSVSRGRPAEIKQGTLAKKRPRCYLAFPDGLELNRREHAGSLRLNGGKGRRIETQGVQNGRRDLGGAHFGADGVGFEARLRQQQNDVGVVMREAAVLGQFRRAAGVSNADVRGHDDVRRAWIRVWVVEVD